MLLIRCPACGLENWAPNVATGICAWCEYDGNEEKTDEVDKERVVSKSES
jgi:hypothetical protein